MPRGFTPHALRLMVLLGLLTLLAFALPHKRVIEKEPAKMIPLMNHLPKTFPSSRNGKQTADSGFDTSSYMARVNQLSPEGVNNWANNGPYGGDIRSIAIDSKNPNILYVGTGGGIYKSTDGGTNWSVLNTGLENSFYIWSLAVDPNNPAVLYAGIENNGIYKSTNGGIDWVAVNTGLGSFNVWAIAIDPNNPSILYAGTANAGLYKSVNGGGSWTSINTGVASSAFILSVTIDPSNSSILYAGSYGNGVYKSTNGGASWTSINSGFGNVLIIRSVTIDATNPATLYAGTDGNGIYKSINGGTSWVPVNNGIGNAYIWALAIDPLTSRTLYAACNPGGIYKTTDGGTNWSSINTGLVGLEYRSVAINPITPTVLYAGSFGKGIYKSIDSGATWGQAINGLSGSSILSLAIDPANPDILYAGTNRNGIHKSTDGGISWATLNSGLNGDFIISTLVINPSNPNIVYAGTNIGIYKSTDGGITWGSAKIGLGNSLIRALAIDMANPTIIYAGSFGNGVYKSVDSALSWTPVNNGLGNTTIFSLAINSNNPAILYAGTSSGIYKTENGGVIWSAASNGIGSSNIFSLAIDPGNPATVYAGTNGGGVYKTVNAGMSWTPINAGLNNRNVLAVAVDPNIPSVLYAGTDRANVFKSIDGGITWNSFSIGLSDARIYALAIDLRGRGVHAGTDGGGVFDYQYNCTYSVSTAGQPLPVQGGTGSLSVTAPAGCSWRVNSRDNWLTITSGSSGSGNGTINVAVTANPNNSARTATLDFAGLNFQTINTTANISQAAGKTDTTTTVSSSVNPSAINQPVTFTATVTPAPGSSGTPTGTITFRDNGVLLGTGTLNKVSLVATTPDHPIALATDGADIFASGTNSSGNNSLFKVPLGGGAVSRVYSNVGPSPSGIVVAGSDLIWFDPNSGPSTDTQILKAPKSGAGSITPIYTGGPVGQPIVDGYGLATDGARLYTADEVQGRVHSLNFDGSNLQQIGPNRYGGFFDTEHTNNIAESGGILYIADGGCNPCRNGSTITPKIVAIPTNGQTFTTLFEGAPLIEPVGITVGNGNIFIADRGANAIWSMPLTGGTPTVVVSGAPFVRLYSVLFFNNALYVADYGATPTGTGAIYKIDLASPASGTFTTSSLTAGTHSITAEYSGDSNFNGSMSAPFLQSVLGADLALTNTVSPNPVLVGGQLTYTITVTNNGPGAANSFVVTDVLPATTTFVSCAATGGGSCGGTGNNRSASFASLAAGASVTVTLNATVTGQLIDGDSISNTAAVSSSITDPDLRNNSATATVRIRGVAQARLTLSGGKSGFDFDAITVRREPPANPPFDTFTVENNGNAPLVLTFASILRTGSDVDGQKITNADDRNLYSLRAINASGIETPIGIGAASTIGIGQRQSFRVYYNPVMPLVADRTRGLTASQVLQDLNTSILTINPNDGAPLRVNLTGRITPTVQMISPVVFRRTGSDIVIEASAYDPNLNTYLMRFQFLDSAGRNVGLAHDVELRAAIQASTIVKGQSFVVEQRFPGAASNQNLVGVRVTAYDGEGDSTATSSATSQTVNALATVSAASYSEYGIASDAMASSFGVGFATTTIAVTSRPLPTALGGTTVKIKDSMGTERLASLFYVSPTQVNYLIPADTKPGLATIIITSGDGQVAMGTTNIAWVAPSLFSANSDGQGVAAAAIQRVKADGTQSYEAVATFDTAQKKMVAVPIDLGTAAEQVYLTLFGTGIRHCSAMTAVQATIGGVALPVAYAGAQGDFVGLDQVNVLLPRNLIGRGEVEVKLMVDYQPTNTVKINIR